jgi:nuclear pore complex protein Nup133
MATFSPSPAPRRSSRQTHGNSPSRRSQIIRQAPIPLHFPHDTASNASAMDIDERGSTITEHSSKVGSDSIFSKTPEMSVSFYANLPLEVKQVLRTSGASPAYHRPQLHTYHFLQISTRIYTPGKSIH